jgi:hypothetical protein
MSSGHVRINRQQMLVTSFCCPMERVHWSGSRTSARNVSRVAVPGRTCLPVVFDSRDSFIPYFQDRRVLLDDIYYLPFWESVFLLLTAECARGQLSYDKEHACYRG